MATLLFQAYMRLRPISLPPPDTFAGQTAVVTGGMSGLGFGAAVHLLRLGAAEVIISARDASRGRDAAAQIVKVFELDISRYDSVVAFAEKVKQVKRGAGGVDVVILNAGMISAEYEKGPEGCAKKRNQGWREKGLTARANRCLPTIQGTKPPDQFSLHDAAGRTPPPLPKIGARPPPLVGSIRYTEPDIDRWHEWANTQESGSGGGGVIEHLNRPENFGSAGVERYASTKLLLQYAFEELVKLARKDGDNDGPYSPQVIMNTVCPGILRTSLARDYQARGGLGIRLAMGAFQGLFGKSAADGARSYLAAVTTKEEQHGDFIQFYKSES
ncbi:short chain dehydrogenase/ reductase [Apiospora saccharicola]|uniref:Short chain dehydrogenase/ reductase n=1 Tax=Apiospora saccharicola TaxID=335842 RepID=A0ABR1W3V6_9PEZI